MKNADFEQVLSEIRMTLCLCGSISSVATPHLLAWLRSIGINSTNVILSESASKFVTVESIVPFTSGRVFTEIGLDPSLNPTHIKVAEESDVVVVAPATANTLAKIATGVNDAIVPQVVLASAAPVIVAPVMSAVMLGKPSTKRNIQQLRDDGLTVLEPRSGVSVGTGKNESGSLQDFREIFSVAIKLAQKYKNRDGD